MKPYLNHGNFLEARAIANVPHPVSKWSALLRVWTMECWVYALEDRVEDGRTWIVK